MGEDVEGVGDFGEVLVGWRLSVGACGRAGKEMDGLGGHTQPVGLSILSILLWEVRTKRILLVGIAADVLRDWFFRRR